MNRKPVLRTETLTERRLKRQLRRFIQIQSLVIRCKPSVTMTEKAKLNWYATNLWFAVRQMKTPRIGTHYNRHETILKEVYRDVKRMIDKARRDWMGWTHTDLWIAEKMSERCKQALHQTRRDKEMTE